MGSINSSGSDCRPTSWILGRRPPGLGFGLLTICLHILHSVFKIKNVIHVFYPFLPSHSRWDPAIIEYHFTVPGWAEILCLVSPGQMMPLRPSRGDCPFVALRSTDIQCFMQHDFLFPKVASPSQCASLRHDVRHCTCSLALLTFFSDISGMQYAMAPCLAAAGREIYTKCCQYIHLPSDTKLSTRSTGCQLQSDEIPDSKITHQQCRSAP